MRPISCTFSIIFIILVFLSSPAWAVGFDDVTREQVMSSLMSQEGIDFSTHENGRISIGTVLGYQTNEGRFGKLKVLSEASSKVTFQWETWAMDGLTFSSGDGLGVTWTWAADLDLGVQAAASDKETPDFWLHNVDGVQRQLVPQNSARFGLLTAPLADFPQLADGGGNRSELLLTNWGPDHATGVLYLLNSVGKSMSWLIGGRWHEGVEYSIPPNGIFRIVTDGTGDTKVGHAVLCPDGGYNQITGTIVYQIEPYELSVSMVQASQRFHVFVQRVLGMNSGIAVTNPNPSDLTIQAAMVDQDGTVLETAEIVLPAWGHRAQFLSELFTSVPEEFQGTVHLQSDTDPFTMVGIRQKLSGSIALLPGKAESTIDFAPE